MAEYEKRKTAHQERAEKEKQNTVTTAVSHDDLSQHGPPLVKEENKQNGLVSSALQSADRANEDLQVMARFMGVNYQALIMCLVKEIGWLGIIRCIRSGDDFLSCISANVDLGGLLACAGGSVAVGNSGGGDFEGEI